MPSHSHNKVQTPKSYPVYALHNCILESVSSAILVSTSPQTYHGTRT